MNPPCQDEWVNDLEVDLPWCFVCHMREVVALNAKALEAMS